MTFEITARIAQRGFDVSLQVKEGETLALLGPNGAGKSTLVNLIAGLISPDEGRASLKGTVLFDTDRRHRIQRPPHLRKVSLLAQDPLLFPHLSALENVAFGPRSTGTSRAHAREQARSWLETLGAGDLAERRPAQLSGGQEQRVALARALAPDPELLLLDEPMAALDVSFAQELRRMLRRVLHDRSTILITHDVLDAFTLADRVAVLHEGRVIEQGPTRDVLERPRNVFTAQLAALNLLTGTVTATGLRDDDGHEIRLDGVDQSLALGSSVAAAFPASSVAVAPADSSAPGVNRIRAQIRDLEPRGDIVRIHSDLVSADLPPAAVAQLALGSGDEVDFLLDPTAIVVYPRA
ncbi:sulfate/molybdate ABC transporter ATP-binding protein [Rathayibacter toxicus]|uniref:sulfate/molybdate ABC transporter ATP-binding protein n=1 Tax=Rathayibacter toxicus TaxID=145458 RepID=UPI001C0569D4|nr:ABC transporter ATP-binding protein [Rathayibacter toxicus]QWL30198.1 ABC transporter ATP-binding protein [Rathayibacter toxicus]